MKAEMSVVHPSSVGAFSKCRAQTSISGATGHHRAHAGQARVSWLTELERHGILLRKKGDERGRSRANHAAVSGRPRPLADPLVGLLITAVIFGIVWQSGKAVFTRLLGGVDPHVTAELRRAAEHVPGIAAIDGARARWVGHRLHAEADVVVEAELPAREAAMLAERLRRATQDHLPAVSRLHVEIRALHGPAAEHAAAEEHQSVVWCAAGAVGDTAEKTKGEAADQAGSPFVPVGRCSGAWKLWDSAGP